MLYNTYRQIIREGRMSKTDTITINGVQYDSHTGMPVAAATEVSPKMPRSITQQPQPSAALHNKQQKSQTLNRKIANKHTQATPKKQLPRKTMDISRSPSIRKFAPRPIVQPASVVSHTDVPATAHPIVEKATAKSTRQHHSRAAHKPAHVLKNEAISKAFAASDPKHTTAKKNSPSLKQRFPRLFSVASASLAVVLLAGYLTYLNIPTISIRIAATQAGINATYPSYKPDGYRLNGPIAYSNGGEVSMNFVANASTQNFTITEKKSSWDSTAVLDNHIKPVAGENYTTHTEAGLTIYTHGTQAAWVNRGILYTIDGDAPLSNDQVRRIATSL